MSCPTASLVHDVPGRLRLRVEEKVGNCAYFELAVRALSGCPSVRHVTGSPLTGSLLIVHAGQPSAIAAFARDQALFDLLPARRPQTFTHIQHEVQKLDATLRGVSKERWGVPGLTFYGLIGAGVWQLARGRVLPPTVTLLFQALNVFKLALEAEEKARTQERSG
jgi:hypothetical protein